MKHRDDSWPGLTLRTRRSKFLELRDLVDGQRADSAEEEQIAQELSRFLTIRAAGYLEITLRTCIEAYVERQASPNVASLVRDVYRGQSLEPQGLEDRIRSISGEMAEDFREFLSEEDNELRRELGSLRAVRNRIAHGESERIGRRQALNFAETADKVAEWLIAHFRP